MDCVSMFERGVEIHHRTIIHLDMDCFYAQVEEIRDPTLRCRPLGIQQKNIIVTCNYNARQRGVKKLMLVEDAKRICPDIVLIIGEDLTPYRQMSQKIFEILLNYTPIVEKLGFDENFIDVSALVRRKYTKLVTNNLDLPELAGNVYPKNVNSISSCSCGCAIRLILGTKIAQEIREILYLKLGITCSAGISYNKLLAKLIGGQHKPNQQTVLASIYAEQFLRELGELKRITGIGQKTEALLIDSGITNIGELQCCDVDILRKKFGYETAIKLKALVLGRDSSEIRPSGKPKTISLEDSCKSLSVRKDVEERFRVLLLRLMEQVAEDGRIPISVKIILRKFDVQKNSSHRETKQMSILPSLFKLIPCSKNSINGNCAKVTLADGAQEKLLITIMRLFERIIDLKKPFNITLIGLAFSKFQQRKMGSASIANFLIRKNDLEVQSITSITNRDIKANTDLNLCRHSSKSSPCLDDTFNSLPTTFKPSDQFYRRRNSASSPIPMLIDNGSESIVNSDFSDFSETEVEPSPKKIRISQLLLKKKRFRSQSDLFNFESDDISTDLISPSKLRVCDLRLNSHDSDRECPTSSNNTLSSSLPIISVTSSLIKSSCVVTMPTETKFPTITTCMTLPCSRNNSINEQTVNISSSCNNNFTVINDTSKQLSQMDCNTSCNSLQNVQNQKSHLNSDPAKPIFAEILSTENNNTTTTAATVTKTNGDLSYIAYPKGIDMQVFNELPPDVQKELIISWRNSLTAAIANGRTSVGSINNDNVTTVQRSDTSSKCEQRNTLYRYFLRHK